ncbi:MAG: hypothetical protein AAF772_11485, partial [Acidobacteriota bacterium]
MSQELSITLGGNSSVVLPSDTAASGSTTVNFDGADTLDASAFQAFDSVRDAYEEIGREAGLFGSDPVTVEVNDVSITIGDDGGSDDAGGGEPLVITLPDGTSISLATDGDSETTVSFDDDEVEIEAGDVTITIPIDEGADVDVPDDSFFPNPVIDPPGNPVIEDPPDEPPTIDPPDEDPVIEDPPDDPPTVDPPDEDPVIEDPPDDDPVIDPPDDPVIDPPDDPPGEVLPPLHRLAHEQLDRLQENVDDMSVRVFEARELIQPYEADLQGWQAEKASLESEIDSLIEQRNALPADSPERESIQAQIDELLPQSSKLGGLIGLVGARRDPITRLEARLSEATPIQDERATHDPADHRNIE